MVAIPDDDVADAHGNPDPAGTLDLGAADLDRIAVTDIFLDRRRQPRCCHFEIDRTGAKPPPQPAKAAGEDHDQRRDHDRKALYPAFAGKPPAQRAELISNCLLYTSPS